MEREFGALQARMDTVEEELLALRRDVREIRDALVKVSGGYTALSLLIGLAVSTGAAMASLWQFITGPH